jgi:uncharacterized damage-inducible protein DinB
MATSNPLDIQLEHDQWATTQILRACEGLSNDQFARKFEIGPGSLQATLTHMIAAKKTWTDTLMGRPPTPRIDQTGAVYSPAQLVELHQQSGDEFMAVARKHALDEIVKRTREGKEFSFTRGVVITHVTTHGMHHRAQCLNMLRHLGVKPLPMSSVAEWARTADSA